MTVHPIRLNQMRQSDGAMEKFLNGNAKAPVNPEATTTPDRGESATQHIIDSSETHIAFNVMPDRPVREQLRMRRRVRTACQDNRK